MARWTEDEKSDKRARGLLMLSISSEALREEVLRAESAIQATAVVEREMNRFLERAKEKKIEREDVTDELTPPVTPESKRARTHTQVKAERTPPESAKSEEGIRVSYEDDFGIERDDVPASPRRRWSREPSPSFYEMLNNRNARSRSDSPLRTWRNETSSRLQGRAGSSSVKRKYQATVEDCDDSEPEAGKYEILPAQTTAVDNDILLGEQASEYRTTTFPHL